MPQLRLATLNCLNLALAQRRTYEGLAPYSTDEYLAKTQWLASLFDRMTDVWFGEETQRSMKALVERLAARKR